jgi:hypothetical protein
MYLIVVTRLTRIDKIFRVQLVAVHPVTHVNYSSCSNAHYDKKFALYKSKTAHAMEFQDPADAATVLSYAHCENLILGSSKTLVSISASQRVTGKIIKCGARKLNSKPRGPAFDIGNRLIQESSVIACDSFDQPVDA